MRRGTAHEAVHVGADAVLTSHSPIGDDDAAVVMFQDSCFPQGPRRNVYDARQQEAAAPSDTSAAVPSPVSRHVLDSEGGRRITQPRGLLLVTGEVLTGRASAPDGPGLSTPGATWDLNMRRRSAFALPLCKVAKYQTLSLIGASFQVTCLDRTSAEPPPISSGSRAEAVNLAPRRAGL